MQKIYQNTLFYLVVFCVTYFIYVYPFEILNELIFAEKPNRRSSFYYTIIISVLIIFYFRSYASLKPLRIFIYEGMGIGFISFWIMTFANLINSIFYINSYFIGLISLFIMFASSLHAVEKTDIGQLKDWRNNSEYRKYFREYRELSNEDQKSWYENSALKSTYTFRQIFCLNGILSIGSAYRRHIVADADFCNRSAIQFSACLSSTLLTLLIYVNRPIYTDIILIGSWSISIICGSNSFIIFQNLGENFLLTY